MALPVLLLGVLTLLGTAVTVLVAPLTPRDDVPVCCRRRVDAFAARSRLIITSGALLTGVGIALFLAGEG